MAEQFDAYYKWLGIPPEDQPPHHYRLLGLRTFKEDADVIDNAADQRMSHLRSFQAGQRAGLSQQLLNEVAAARACLLNAEEKIAYDAELRGALEAEQRSAPASAAAAAASEPVRVVAPAPVQPAPPASPAPQPTRSQSVPISTSHSSARRTYSRRKKSSAAPVVVAAVVVITVVVGAVVFALNTSSDDNRPSLTEGSQPNHEDPTTIEPADDRVDAAPPERTDSPRPKRSDDMPAPGELLPPDRRIPNPALIDTPGDPPTDDRTQPSSVITSTDGESIWIEGESATIKQIVPLDWYDKVKKHTLSGGAWLGHFADGEPGYAAYDFQASNNSDYRFWLRANPIKCKLFWRLNEGAWQQIDFSSGLRDKANIAADDKLDIRFIAWKEVGDIRLKRGSNRIEFRMEVKENENLRQHHGAIDCMCLTTDDWEPSGISKPPQR